MEYFPAKSVHILRAWFGMQILNGAGIFSLDVTMEDTQKIIIMSAPEVEQSLNRLAEELLRRYSDLSRLALVGIRTGGAFLAQRLGTKIKAPYFNDGAGRYSRHYLVSG